MADSRPWYKTLRRFGSRLSVSSADRLSLSLEPGQRVWQARYDHHRQSDAAAAAAAEEADNDGYSASVELVPVTRRSHQPLHGDSDGGEGSRPRGTQNRHSLARTEGCHAEICESNAAAANDHQHPATPSAGAAEAIIDPEPMGRRPLPPLPPSRRADDGRLRFLSAQLSRLSHQGWYWGPITIEETKVILDDLPDGSYLVRDSHSDDYLLAIGLRADGRTVHTRISHCNGRFMFAHHRHSSARSIDELIEHGMFVRGRHHQMLYPVSRLMRMRSLKEYSRLAVRRCIAIDRIDDLEIPVTLKRWLKENPY